MCQHKEDDWHKGQNLIRFLSLCYIFRVLEYARAHLTWISSEGIRVDSGQMSLDRQFVVTARKCTNAKRAAIVQNGCSISTDSLHQGAELPMFVCCHWQGAQTTFLHSGLFLSFWLCANNNRQSNFSSSGKYVAVLIWFEVLICGIFFLWIPTDSACLERVLKESFWRE